MSPDPDRVSAGVRRYEVTTIRLDEKRCYDVTTYDVTTYDVTTYDAICCDVTMLRCYERSYDDTMIRISYLYSAFLFVIGNFTFFPYF